jgi:hypothetical protein
MPGRATPVNDAAVPTASSSAAGQVGFCVTGEPVLYACELEGGSIVSVCGAENANGQRFAQYRFGRAGRTPELVWPSTAEPGELTIARVGYSGGGALQIRFDRGGSTYIVHSSTIRTQFDGAANAPEFRDGLAVRSGNRWTFNQACARALDGTDPDDLLGQSINSTDIVELPE